MAGKDQGRPNRLRMTGQPEPFACHDLKARALSFDSGIRQRIFDGRSHTMRSGGAGEDLLSRGDGWKAMADIAAALSAREAVRRMPTSVLLEQLKRDIPEGTVTFGWLIDYLRGRSPAVLVLFLALIGVLPGVSLLVGILLAPIALAMMSARIERTIPVFIASQHMPSGQLVRAIDRTIGLFRWGERYIRPRDASLAEFLQPFASFAILILGLSMLVPLPLSNVIPSLVIGLIAFAIIEADGLLLAVAMAASLLSLAISAAVVWATFGAAIRIWG
jgi:hypothetical protein